METVFLFKKEDKAKVDELLSKDEYRELSINFKDPEVLGFEEEEGTQYLCLKGNDKMVSSVLEGSEQEDGTKLLEKAENEDKILQKIEDEESAANAGMGAIFG